MAEAAGYLALVTRTNPLGSADSLLGRPDTDAVLRQALDQAAELAADAVQQAWDMTGADDSVAVNWLLEDIARIFSASAHLRGLIRHAHASVPRREFTPGVSSPGTHPSQRAAEERADAVRDAVLGWARKAALRVRMAAGMAGGAGSAVALIDSALAREAAGERLAKRWRAHPESPSCCFWCRRLNGVTIPLRASFAPYLGGPAAMPQARERRVASPAGERRYGLRLGEQIIYTNPPRLYHGRLQGPLLHPFCRCRLEIVHAAGPPGAAPAGSGGHPAPGRFLSAADVRDMPGDAYQADLAFLKAAAHELGQVLRRLAEGSG
jgi:hypothetical protein